MSRFADALRTARTPVLMEVKRRGAHGEDLLAGRTVPEVVAAYERLGAPCLSVVTGRWFGGDQALLRDVVARTALPVLEKDFVATERRVAEAHAAGASAVLLTAALVPAASLRRLAGACLSRGLTPFVEVTEPAHLDRLGDAEGCVVAVSNKDIRRRERDAADVGRSLALLPAVRAAGAARAVSASGIADPQTAARLLDAGFDALLVGTGLLTAPDMEGWLAATGRHRRHDRAAA